MKQLWDRVDKTKDCWVWQGPVTKRGYGRVYAIGKTWRAHRLAYHIIFGDIPKGMLVCHSCDNPPCCNPEHLFLGTNKDNSEDMVNKNRSFHTVGEDNPVAILTEEIVKEIILAYTTSKTSYSKLALHYDVSISAIRDVIKGRRWAYLTEDLRNDVKSIGCGERISLSKLTENDIVNIRLEYAIGNITCSNLGKRYGVSAHCIGDVVRRVTWKHVA